MSTSEKEKEYPIKVSIVVPCYNIGKLMQPLFQSLEEQDYKGFEVIFINDESTDDTLDVVKAFCDNAKPSPYKRYKLIDNMHGGPCVTRNTGLEAAVGDYVMFVDGDDNIFPQTISKLVGLMTDGVDIVVGSFINTDGTIIKFPHIKNWDKWLGATTTIGGLTLWNKLFRRSIIEEHHIRFDLTVKKSEDHFFTAQYMVNMKGNVAVTDYVIYNYRLNPTGTSNIHVTTHKFSPEKGENVYTAGRIYRMMEGKLSAATKRELRYDTYHKYRRVRHEAHELDCKDKSFYDGIYNEIRRISPLWEIVYFAIRRRISILSRSAMRKIRRRFS